MRIHFRLLFLSVLLFTLIPGALTQVIRTDIIPGSEVTFLMALIPGDTFLMGSPDEAHQRRVKLDSFWIGVHEVSYDEFLIFYQKEYDSNTTTHPEKNMPPMRLPAPHHNTLIIHTEWANQAFLL